MKNHSRKNLLLFGAVLASCCAAPLAAAAKFVRPGLLHFSYAESGYDAKAGGGVAVGADWGPARQHEVSFEAGRAGWAFHQPGGLAALTGRTGDGDVTSLLVGYRYYLGAAAAKFRPYAGAQAGVLLMSGDAAVFLSGVAYGGSLDETQAVYGATVGVAVRMTGSVSLDVGYRFLGAQDISAESRFVGGAGGFSGSAGPALKLPAPSAHVAALALKVEW